MRGSEGVHDVSMLVRRSPFAEWVTVYYDQTKTSEKALLAKIRAGGCPNAALIQRPKGDAITMNPFTAPGDVVQLKITLKKKTTLTPTLPDGWKLTSPVTDLKAGTHHLSVKVASKAKKKKHTLSLKEGTGTNHSFNVEIVSLVP